MYVQSRDLLGYEASCFDRTVAPRGCNNAKLGGM
jgi:hypothetical protein